MGLIVQDVGVIEALIQIVLIWSHMVDKDRK